MDSTTCQPGFGLAMPGASTKATCIANESMGVPSSDLAKLEVGSIDALTSASKFLFREASYMF